MLMISFIIIMSKHGFIQTVEHDDARDVGGGEGGDQFAPHHHQHPHPDHPQLSINNEFEEKNV